MTGTSTPVHIQTMTRGLYPYGRFAGQSAVFMEFGGERNESYTVESVISQAESYNWHKRLANGRAILVLVGHDGDRTGGKGQPLANRHADAIEALTDILTIQEVICETTGSRDPVDAVDDAIDHYVIRLPMERVEDLTEEKDDVIQWFADQSSRYGRADFLIHFKTSRQTEDVEDFRHEYVIPDDNIWLLPSGVERETFEKSLGYAETAGKRYGWPVSPRFDRFDI